MMTELEKARQQLEQDVQAWIAKGNKIKTAPIISRQPEKTTYNFAIGKGQDDGRTRKTKVWNAENKHELEIRKCPESGLWHVFQGKKKRSDGFMGQHVANIALRNIRRRISLRLEPARL